MGAYETRNSLTELAARLAEMAQLINKAVTKLDNECENLLPAAVDEQEYAPKVRKVRYQEAGEPDAGNTRSPRITSAPKRACSICRQPGHRATTCPRAKTQNT